MLLTAEERQRFAAWLKQNIESNRLLAGQLEKMGMVAIAKQKQQSVMASIIVLREIENVEEVTLGGAE